MSTIKGDHYPACATWFGEECDCDAWKEAPVRDIREAMHPVSDRPLWTPPLLNSDGSMRAPYVATLPDGSRVNLPAGTVLREQGLAEQVRAGTLGVGMADDPAKLRGAFTREHSPDVVLTQARGLLQRARVPLAETGAADVLADVDAFLAGAAPPEHPVIALVRSFVGKPGEGPEVNIEPLPPHLAALLAEHPRWSIADAERSIVDTTEGRDPPK